MDILFPDAVKFRIFKATLSMIFALAVAALITPSGSSASDSIAKVNLSTSIKSVKIYSSGEVHITRVGTASVPVGDFSVLCTDLPWGFDRSSLEVSAYGDVETRLYSVNVKNCYEDMMNSKRYKELKEKLDELEKKETSIENRIGSLEKRREFLSAIGSYSSDEAHRELSGRALKIEQWRKLLDFFESEHMGIASDVSKLRREKEEISKEMGKIKDEMEELNIAGRKCQKVYLDCSAEAAGEVSFEIKYMMKNASWVPEYRVKLNRETDEVLLTYLAGVGQKTGEDWNDVKLTLSTAQPAKGAIHPPLLPYYIPRWPEEPLGARVKKQVRTPVSELKVESAKVLSQKVLSREETRVLPSQFATNFSIARPVSLQSGGESRRFLIKEDKIKGTFSLYAAPVVSKNVYLKGKFKNTTSVPILPGDCEVYVVTGSGDNGVVNYVGDERLSKIAPGEEFVLYFGIDQDIKVDKKRVKKEILSKSKDKKKKIRYHYLITVQSFKKKQIKLELKDRIPVSTVRDIRITDVDISPKPDDKKDNGILTWNLTLEPGVKNEVRIAYTIVFPGGYPSWQVE